MRMHTHILQDAYRHYLACVQYMVQTLSSDIPSNGGRGALPTQQATKLFTLARNCLERAESIYSTAQEEQRALDSGRQETQGMGSGHASVMQGGGGGAVSQRVGVATAPHRPVSIPNVQQRCAWGLKICLGNGEGASGFQL